jgi:5-methylcytosine-specific restriction protein A
VHAAELERQRNARRPDLVRFYKQRAWKDLSPLFLAAHPVCQVCEAAGRLTPAKQVDHIIPVRERPDLALDPSNLRALCASCHSRRTMTDMRRRAR